MEAARHMVQRREKPAACEPAALLADEAVMGRVRDGDGEALAVLFDRYKRRLFGFLYRMVGERCLAEDLLGETFLRIYQRRASFRRGCGFAPWAYRIARNLAIQEIRRQQVSRRAAERLAADSEPAPEWQPERAD